MRTKIQSVSRFITVQRKISRLREGDEILLKEEFVPVQMRVQGFAEVNYAGSIIGPIVHTEALAEIIRNERIRLQKEKHAKSIHRNFARLDRLHAAPLQSRPTLEWAERRQAFVAKA